MCGSGPSRINYLMSKVRRINSSTLKLRPYLDHDSSIFGQLTSAFSPILAAGPGQQGYTPAKIANLNSQAITTSGQQYRNAAQAAGERSAASGGGNNLLPSGVTAGTQAQIAAAGAGQTAGELSNIQQQSAQLGRQNWLSAASVLGAAPGVFNSATSAGQAATGAGSAAGTTANQINQANNSWMTLVSGALGGITSGLTGGLLGGFGGGGSSGSSGPPTAPYDPNLWVPSNPAPTGLGAGLIALRKA